MRKIFFIVFALFFATFCNAEVLTSSVHYKNKKLEYAYYIPSDIMRTKDKVSAIVLVPGLDGKGEDMIDKDWMTFADKKNWIIISPSFVFEGSEAFQKGTSYQYPKVWSGGALNEIFKRFSAKGLKISNLYLMGFSAGAQFVGRYSLSNPQRVKKCAIIASGGNDDITKAVPVKFFYGIGTSDADNRREFADTFEKQAKKYHVSVVKKEYNGVGHSLTSAMQNDVRSFFNAKGK